MTNTEIITALQSVNSMLDKRLSVTGMNNMLAILECSQILNKLCAELQKEAEAS